MEEVGSTAVQRLVPRFRKIYIQISALSPVGCEHQADSLNLILPSWLWGWCSSAQRAQQSV